MIDETERDRIRRMQRQWAEQRGLTVDDSGNVASVDDNLRAAMSTATLKSFRDAASAELVDGKTGSPAKMRALAAPSALIVNMFDYWTARDATPLLRAFGISGTAQSVRLEIPLFTGSAGLPPHLDVLLRLNDGSLVGVESKFTEWMVKKSKQAAKLSPYFSESHATSYWSRAGLTASHQLAKSMLNDNIVFEVLDVQQLLKHMLGLGKAAGGKPWTLLYLYYAGAGEIATIHDAEIARFSAAVGNEVQFVSLTYQGFFKSLSAGAGEQHAEYFGYLRQRYFA